jgi:hypothetical protein
LKENVNEDNTIGNTLNSSLLKKNMVKDSLGPLLSGYITLIDVLEGDFSSRYKEVFELVDFVDRR